MALPQLLKVVIVDDQPVIRKDAETLIAQQSGFIVAGSCGSVKEAVDLIPRINPDLLLLDINLGDGTGFDILERLFPVSYKVIFFTAFEQHAIKAIKYGALDYLLKPLNEQELQQALAKVIQSHPAQQEQFNIALQYLKQDSQPNRLVLRSQDYMHIVSFEEILYCHSNAGYTTFHLTDSRKIMTSRRLKEYEEIFPLQQFLRPHQSYIVNNKFIYKYHKDGFLILKDNTEVPVATRRKDIVMNYLNHIH